MTISVSGILTRLQAASLQSEQIVPPDQMIVTGGRSSPAMAVMIRSLATW